MRDADFATTMLSPAHATKSHDPVERAMMEFIIVSPLLAAMFIATLGHESSGFVHTRELWGPTPAQLRC